MTFSTDSMWTVIRIPLDQIDLVDLAGMATFGPPILPADFAALVGDPLEEVT